MNIGTIGSSGYSSPAEEARETLAQTQAEARKGDQQAVQRLTRLNEQEAPQATTNASTSGTSGQGRILNTRA